MTNTKILKKKVFFSYKIIEQESQIVYRGNDENTKKYFFQLKILSHKMIEHKLKRNVKEKES